MADTTINTPAESRQFDVMTVGDICVDLIVTGNVRPQFHQIEQIVEDCTLELGGSATIFASQMGKLGGRVGVIGSVGDDGFGQFVIERLHAASVDTHLIRQDPSVKTGVGIALSENNDRAILTYLGTIDATRPQDLDEAVLHSCRHWHVTSYFLLNALRNTWPVWLRACRRLGVSTSLDTNWDPENRWQGVTDLLSLVDVFLPNEAEACAISGEADVIKAARILASYGPIVVVKMGTNGAIAVKHQHMWELHPSPQTGLPDLIADATGAGDNFDAWFSTFPPSRKIHRRLPAVRPPLRNQHPQVLWGSTGPIMGEVTEQYSHHFVQPPMRIPKWLMLTILVPAFWGIWGALTEIPEKWISPPFPPTLGYVVWSVVMLPFAALALSKVGWN